MTFNFREVEHSDIDDIKKLKHCRGKTGMGMGGEDREVIGNIEDLSKLSYGNLPDIYIYII